MCDTARVHRSIQTHNNATLTSIIPGCPLNPPSIDATQDPQVIPTPSRSIDTQRRKSQPPTNPPLGIRIKRTLHLELSRLSHLDHLLLFKAEAQDISITVVLLREDASCRSEKSRHDQFCQISRSSRRASFLVFFLLRPTARGVTEKSRKEALEIAGGVSK